MIIGIPPNQLQLVIYLLLSMSTVRVEKFIVEVLLLLSIFPISTISR